MKKKFIICKTTKINLTNLKKCTQKFAHRKLENSTHTFLFALFSIVSWVVYYNIQRSRFSLKKWSNMPDLVDFICSACGMSCVLHQTYLIWILINSEAARTKCWHVRIRTEMGFKFI